MARFIDVNSEITENARKVLEKRYLAKDDDGKVATYHMRKVRLDGKKILGGLKKLRIL